MVTEFVLADTNEAFFLRKQSITRDWGAFRNNANIQEGVFCKKSQRLTAFNSFNKKFHPSRLIKFLIH